MIIWLSLYATLSVFYYSLIERDIIINRINKALVSKLKAEGMVSLCVAICF